MRSVTFFTRQRSLTTISERSARLCSLKQKLTHLQAATTVNLSRGQFSILIQGPRRIRLPTSTFRIAMGDPKELHNGNTADEDDWRNQAPYKEYKKGEGFDLEDIKHEASCHCGRVQYQLNREVPLDSKLCHCRDCQVQHGTTHSNAPLEQIRD